MANTPIRELNIVIIQSPDLEAARAFYGETLGLRVIGETPNFLDVSGDEGMGAHLGITSGRAMNRLVAGGPEVWFRVDDTDAFYGRLKSVDVTIAEEPKDMPFGRTVKFLDPAGNLLGAFQAPQA